MTDMRSNEGRQAGESAHIGHWLGSMQSAWLSGHAVGMSLRTIGG